MWIHSLIDNVRQRCRSSWSGSLPYASYERCAPARVEHPRRLSLAVETTRGGDNGGQAGMVLGLVAEVGLTGFESNVSEENNLK
jgi:hypothetical protein